VPTSDADRQSERPVIREFTLDDFDEVTAVWEASGLWMRPSDSREAIALKTTRDPDLFLVALVDGRIVGTALGGWDGRRAYVYHLAVVPERQRRGIASLLMDELDARFRAKGALKAKLQILVGNAASLAFFAARGYEIEEECLSAGKELVPGGAPRDWSPPSGKTTS
jgi:ribosomal protein S18 acetylase RimI-like enzyme